MKKSNFKSCSGDKYYVPEEQYDTEVAEYKDAIERGDEATMLCFEEGETGRL